ncbi:MAG: hypothetical protein ACFCD0_04695 [Gemmataceae bacterium]
MAELHPEEWRQAAELAPSVRFELELAALVSSVRLGLEQAALASSVLT